MVLIVLGVLVLLDVAGRVALPHFVLGFVNKRLADLGELTGHADDLALDFYTGRAVFTNVEVWHKDSLAVPVFYMESLVLAVDWRALWSKEDLVGRVELIEPVINAINTGQKVVRRRLTKAPLPTAASSPRAGMRSSVA